MTTATPRYSIEAGGVHPVRLKGGMRLLEGWKELRGFSREVPEHALTRVVRALSLRGEIHEQAAHH